MKPKKSLGILALYLFVDLIYFKTGEIIFKLKKIKFHCPKMAPKINLPPV
jgi:hypothetical protein